MAGTRHLHIVGIAGSLRAKSLNRALLRSARASAPASMTIAIFDLIDPPLYNGDVEDAGDPRAVAQLKTAIAAADGVLMVTPEYNHGVPAVMKNAVDWASRPPRGAVLGGKPVALMGASPGMTGTARGQSQLRQAFEFTNSFAMPPPSCWCSGRTRSSAPTANSPTPSPKAIFDPSCWRSTRGSDDSFPAEPVQRRIPTPARRRVGTVPSRARQARSPPIAAFWRESLSQGMR